MDVMDSFIVFSALDIYFRMLSSLLMPSCHLIYYNEYEMDFSFFLADMSLLGYLLTELG